MQLILYSKPGCHLCAGLQEKLEQILQTRFSSVQLEIRDITTKEDWLRAYEYEVPVLFLAKPTATETQLQPIPRPSPRVSVSQLEKILQKYI